MERAWKCLSLVIGHLSLGEGFEIAVIDPGTKQFRGAVVGV
jgi:hypothetical protein